MYVCPFSTKVWAGVRLGEARYWLMAVSDRDRAKMASIARDLAAIETDEEPPPERRAEIIAWANRARARDGMPPLADQFADPPEEEFYRRARALGMGDSGRRSP